MLIVICDQKWQVNVTCLPAYHYHWSQSQHNHHQNHHCLQNHRHHLLLVHQDQLLDCKLGRGRQLSDKEHLKLQVDDHDCDENCDDDDFREDCDCD